MNKNSTMSLGKCAVCWESPSEDSLGSMPLGNGDLGGNLWVEPDGRIHLYPSKTDAWDENHRLLKLGELILECDGPVDTWLADGFRQRLDLEAGRIDLIFGPPESPAATVRVWADACRPCIWLEAESVEPLCWRVRLRTWRTERRVLDVREAEASLRQDGVREHAVEQPDTTVNPEVLEGRRIGLYHRNQKSILPGLLRHQDMGERVGQIDDPLEFRTFGCLVQASGPVSTRGGFPETVLETKQSERHAVFTLVAHTSRPATAEQWVEVAAALADEVLETDADEARERHEAWWAAFWQRSYIDVTGDAAAEAITRACVLQRYMTACAGRGSFPIKFNGSLFTMAGPPEKRKPEDEPRRFNADYRRWGGGYWFQNTRLIYWPLLASGDSEMLRPWYALFENAADLCRYRCAEKVGAEGLFFPETMTLWGTYRNDNYGYERDENCEPGLAQNGFIRRYWQGGLELAALMLEDLALNGDGDWWDRRAYPIVREMLRFYRSYYRECDVNGKIRFEPSQSLETWHDATNPAPDIAGLRHVLGALLDLPEERLAAGDRTFYQSFLEMLPPIPVGEGVSGAATILPAERYENRRNMENCALYAIFPYPQGALGGSLHGEALEAWKERPMKKIGGWFQDAVHAALLGLGEEAADLLTAALAPEHADEAQREYLKWPPESGARFPIFRGPNADWVPDLDHINVNLLALQKLCLQTQNGEVRILPCWPKRWNVRFRLHAPGHGLVEAESVDGRVRRLDHD